MSLARNRSPHCEQRDVNTSFIGASPAFCAVRERLQRIAATSATVLIEGETGTGKELAARVIHYEGVRRSGPFIPVNCGAIPDSLLESELFGHRSGAFTDAKESTPGILLLANGGTLFLDEVDSLSWRAQVVLLRFLQERTVRALGAGTERHVDVRVIAACNRNLEKLVAARSFREDLFYRLNVMQVELPPLRERSGDIRLFAEHFLRAFAERYAMPVPDLDEPSWSWLCAQPWPGNIRQLENFLERELLLAGSTPRLHFTVFDAMPPEAEVAADCWNYQLAKTRMLESFDREFLRRLLELTRGNVTQAARLASKERRDFGRLLQKYGISPEHFRR